MAKKADFSGILDNIKSMLNPAGGAPDVDPNDAIGMKIAQLSTLVQQMAKVAEQQEKDFATMNQLLNGLYQDIETLRNPPEEAAEEAVKEEAPKAEAAAKEPVKEATEEKAETKEEPKKEE